MEGLSTSRCSDSRAKRLGKTELVRRIDRQASARYGQRFTDAQLNELIKQGLMPAGRRDANEGQRPTYVFDARAYRRGLQIVRLRRQGVTDRDAIKIALFLKGYSHPAYDVREALWRQYQRTITSAFSETRSRYLDNHRTIPPEQQRRLGNALGPPDDRLVAAGLTLPAELTIAAVRAAKNKPLNLNAKFGPIFDILASDAPKTLWLELSATCFDLIDGMLLIKENFVQESGPEIDYIEKLILTSSNDVLYSIANFYRFVIHFLRNSDAICRFGGIPISSNSVALVSALRKSLGDPVWASLVFGFSLRLEKVMPGFGKSQNLELFDQIVRDGGFTLRELLANIEPI